MRIRFKKADHYDICGYYSTYSVYFIFKNVIYGIAFFTKYLRKYHKTKRHDYLHINILNFSYGWTKNKDVIKRFKNGKR